LPEGNRSRVVDGVTTAAGSTFSSTISDSIRGGIGSSGGIFRSPGGGAAFGRTLRIMVVEDNNITQRVLQTLIEKEGHGTTIASSAEEAIGFLEMGERFDLIFADINLSGITGLEFTRIVRNMPDAGTRNVPIVALSGSVEESDIAACRDAGMTAHLAKPLDPDAFMGIIYSVAQSSASKPGVEDKLTSIPLEVGSTSESSSAVSMLEDDVDIMIPTETYAHMPEVPEPESNIQSAEPRFYATLEIDLIGTLQESLGVDQLIQLLLGLYKKAEEIITALESQDIIDPDFTRARAHEMKGMAGNFGFQKLSDQARNIEKIVKTGSIEGVQEMILELNPIYQQSRADLDHWLRSKSSK